VATPPSALHIFVRERCPHRAQAELFLIGLARERPAVPIVDRPVGEDPRPLALVPIARAASIWPPGVLRFVFDGRMPAARREDAESASPPSAR
jgi:hypothetical protein